MYKPKMLTFLKSRDLCNLAHFIQLKALKQYSLLKYQNFNDNFAFFFTITKNCILCLGSWRRVTGKTLLANKNYFQ